MGDSDMARKSALLISRNMPPLRGGMERLMEHMARSLAKVYDLSIVGPDGCSAFLPPLVIAKEVRYRPLPRFLLGAAKAVRNFTQRKFSIVIAGSGLTAPLAWWAARRTGASFVVYLHGLDVIAPNFFYQAIWLPFIRRADLVLVNSRNTRRLAIERGVPEQTIEILHPGTELTRPHQQEGARIRAAHGWGDRPLLLSVGRLTPRKGLVEFVARAFPTIIASKPDALLVVVGADAVDAVRPAEGSEYARIARSAERAGVADSVHMVPHCDDATLLAAYSAADVYIFPVLSLPGDVEGFGMVAIEAAARGLPTVGFKTGGVPDAVLDGITGSLADVGNYDELAMLACQWLDQRHDFQARMRCAEAAAVFGWDRFSEKLHAALDRKTRSYE